MSEPTIELYMLRHAESELNLHRNLVGGRSNDAPLSARGPSQARQLGRELLDLGVEPDAVFSSPAVRCRDTARYCLEAMGCSLEIVVDDRLQEASQGIWERRPRHLVYTDTVVAQIRRQGKNFAAPGGESVNQVATRELALLDDIVDYARESGKKTFLAYGHGYAIRILAGTILGWSMDEMRREVTPNASNSSLVYEPCSTWSVRNVGDLTITGATYSVQ